MIKFVMGILYLPAVLVLLVTCSIPDEVISNDGEEKTAEREAASFPGYQFFSYLDSMIYRGYKGTLDYDDLHHATPREKTSYLHPRMWENLLERDKRWSGVGCGADFNILA